MAADPEPFPDLDFELPPERIAQHPSPERDASRLLVLDRCSGKLAHRRFRDLPELLCPGDLVVRNISRVIPARLRGRKSSGGRVEALLLAAGPDAEGAWPALLRLSGRARIGLELHFRGAGGEARAEVVDLGPGGEVALRFSEVGAPARAGRAVTAAPHMGQTGSHRPAASWSAERGAGSTSPHAAHA